MLQMVWQPSTLPQEMILHALPGTLFLRYLEIILAANAVSHVYRPQARRYLLVRRSHKQRSPISTWSIHQEARQLNKSVSQWLVERMAFQAPQVSSIRICMPVSLWIPSSFESQTLHFKFENHGIQPESADLFPRLLASAVAPPCRPSRPFFRWQQKQFTAPAKIAGCQIHHGGNQCQWACGDLRRPSRKEKRGPVPSVPASDFRPKKHASDSMICDQWW